MANLEHPTNREEAYLYGFIDSGFSVPEPVTRKEAYLKELVDKHQILDRSDYVTPELFGAVADGVNDDVEAIEKAIDTGKVVFLTGQYYISRPINIVSNTRIYGDKIGKRFDQPVDTNYIKSSTGFFHSDSSLTKIQLLDISLWDASGDSDTSLVFDSNIERCDIRIYGYNIHTFSNQMQQVRFNDCFFISTLGPISPYISDCTFSNCYFSGKKTTTSNPLFTGTLSAFTLYGCYIDFWYTVFNVTTYSVNNMIFGNVFDACYHVFTGKYNGFGVINNVFMRIKDSSIWTLGESDWCVFCNGLRNNTRSIGNRVDANYYIHTNLTGSNYPNTNSYSAFNSLESSTAIKWNPYPNDATDLLNTRVEELNYKTYTTLPNASLTSGSAERFNHQFAFSGGNLYINNGGTWLQLS